MKGLVIGAGEVGTALFDVLSINHETYIRDVKERQTLEGIEILNICYPDHDGFEETTKAYIKQYNPVLTIIHSSVKFGTTEKCGEHVVYSPIRGRHPKLSKDLLIYCKFIFGKSMDVLKASDYLSKAGMNVYFCKNPSEGELLKLISNIHMGLEIAWRQEVERIFNEFGFQDNHYDLWEKTYAQGCVSSGDSHIARPIMNPGPIGGHCILPCTDLLLEQYDSPFLKLIKESNEKVKKQKEELCPA